MNLRIHNTAMKMDGGGPRGWAGASRRPFRARRDRGFYPGFRRSGSTLSYIPAAASRLRVFKVLPDINVMHNDLEGYFRKRHLGLGVFGVWRMETS